MSALLVNDVIAETLLITVYSRAIESQKPNPIINDPIAIDLVARLPYDFRHFDNKPSTSVGVAIRANYFDEQAKQFLNKHPDGVIVNLGCGLDTRLQRLGATAQYTPFYSLDIQEVIELRQQYLPPLANETLITDSMFDTAWLQQLKAKHPQQPVLLLAEGVMMYFDASQNKQFLNHVADHLERAYLHFDCPSLFFSTKSEHHSTVKYTKARFRFGLDDPKTLQMWDGRWQYLQHCYFSAFKETWRMGKLMGFLMNYIPPFKNSFMMVAYQLKQP